MVPVELGVQMKATATKANHQKHNEGLAGKYFFVDLISYTKYNIYKLYIRMGHPTDDWTAVDCFCSAIGQNGIV